MFKIFGTGQGHLTFCPWNTKLLILFYHFVFLYVINLHNSTVSGINLMSYFKFGSEFFPLLKRQHGTSAAEQHFQQDKNRKAGQNNHLTKQLVEGIWEQHLGRKYVRF